MLWLVFDGIITKRLFCPNWRETKSLTPYERVQHQLDSCQNMNITTFALICYTKVTWCEPVVAIAWHNFTPRQDKTRNWCLFHD